MKLLSWVSLLSGAPALALLLVVMLGAPERRSQTLSLQLPLNFAEPEATLAFVPSMFLASLALVAGAPAFQRPLARVGLVLGATSWLGILLGMGPTGFRALF